MLTTFQALHKLMGGMALSPAQLADALEVAKSYAKRLGITLDDFVFLIRNKQYEYNKNTAYDTEGLSNPMIIGDYVFRGTGSGYTKYLEVRLRRPGDTSEDLKKNYSLPLYQPDQSNNASYTQIHSASDY